MSQAFSEGRNFTKAKVSPVQWQERAAVEKDYSARPFMVRHLLGPLMLNREERALRRLAGIDGIPNLFDRPRQDLLIMERLDGTPLAGYKERTFSLPPGFFTRLRNLVDAMHSRGVAQGDIGSRDVLVRTDGSPGLVDFSVSVIRDVGISGSRLFDAARRQDRRRLARLHRRFGPQGGQPEDPAVVADETSAHQWARRLRRFIPGRRHERQ